MKTRVSNTDWKTQGIVPLGIIPAIVRIGAPRKKDQWPKKSENFTATISNMISTPLPASPYHVYTDESDRQIIMTSMKMPRRTAEGNTFFGGDAGMPGKLSQAERHEIQVLGN